MGEQKRNQQHQVKKTIIDPSDCGHVGGGIENANSDAPFLVGGGIPEYLKSGSRRKFLAAAGLTTAGVMIGAPRSEGAFF